MDLTIILDAFDRAAVYAARMAAGDQIDRLRSRAKRYRHEAGRARERSKRIYYRALASHLEREATELAHITGGVETAAGAGAAPEPAGTFLDRRGRVTVADAVIVGAMASMIVLIWHYIV
jgi:hypothetical protein